MVIRYLNGALGEALLFHKILNLLQARRVVDAAAASMLEFGDLFQDILTDLAGLPAAKLA